MQYIFPIYFSVAAIVFFILLYVDKSDDGYIEFTVWLPQRRESIFFLISIFWPLALISIVSIKWGDKYLFKKDK